MKVERAYDNDGCYYVRTCFFDQNDEWLMIWSEESDVITSSAEFWGYSYTGAP